MHETQMIDVTVAVMSYNNAHFIGQTIESVLAQDGVSFELLVFDDRSQDDSLQVLDRYRDDPRFHYEINPENLGMMGNYNRCVASGRGRYVVVLGSDDVLYPGHLESLVAALDLHPDAPLAYTQCNWIDEHGKPIKRAVHPGHFPHSYFGHRDELVDLLRFDNYITPSAVMLRRSHAESVRLESGLLHAPDLVAGDWELWTRFARRFPKFIFLNQATVGYRVHGGQISTSFYASERPLKEHAEILEINLRDESVLPRLRAAAEPIFGLYLQRLSAYPKDVQDRFEPITCSIRERLFPPVSAAAEGPDFSVIVTTYNRQAMLRNALESLAAQQHRSFEAIVVNDCGSPAELVLTGLDFPITYVALGINQGLSGARNAALKLARGRYVVFLDDDDFFLPDHLQILHQHLVRISTPTVVYTDAWYVGEVLSEGKRIEVSRAMPYQHGAFSLDSLLVQNYIPVNTWCAPRTAAALIEGFDTSLSALEDWEMLLRLSRDHAFLHVQKATVEVRVRASVADHMSKRERKNFPALFREIYARQGDRLNPAIQQARAQVLAALDAERQSAGQAGVPFSPAASGVPNGCLLPEDVPRVASRIAVVCHVSRLEPLDELCHALLRLPPGVHFYFTAPTDRCEAVKQRVIRSFPDARLIPVENRGRDIAPFFAVLRQYDMGQYWAVLKLHTEKLSHPGEQDSPLGGRSTLDDLLPEGQVLDLLARFVTHADVGLVGPERLLRSLNDDLTHASANAGRVRQLSELLRIEIDHHRLSFIVGSMFWVKGSVLHQARVWLDAGLDFEPETGQTDGTLAHAIERAFACLVQRADLKVLSTSALWALAGPAELKPPHSAVTDWLNARIPSRQEACFIEQRLATPGGRAHLGVMILDPSGRPSDVKQTLKSIQSSLHNEVKTVVVSTGRVPPTSPSDPLHFVAVTSETLLDGVNAAVAQSGVDWFVTLTAGTELLPSGLMIAALDLAQAGAAVVATADECHRLPETSEPGLFLRPGMNLDLLLSAPQSMARHLWIKRSHFLALGGFSPAAGVLFEFDFLLRHIEQNGFSGFARIEEVLCHCPAPDPWPDEAVRGRLLQHLAQRGYAAAVHPGLLPGTYRVDYRHPDQPLVSVLIPTRNQLPVLRRCVESLLEKTRYPNYEILVIDNQSDDAETLRYLNGLEEIGGDRLRVLRYPHPFNFSAINNFAAREARGDYLVLLNNDTAILQPDWMDALLNHAQRPEVGCVGAKLLYPDGTVQHAGVILGLRGPADHPFMHTPADAPGYMNRLLVDQNYSAVTAACLMIRKSLYLEVGGMDEVTFKVSYNDVDLCLKVLQAGHLNVWTPHAVVMHEGGVSQFGLDPDAVRAKQARFEGEQMRIYERWLPHLAHDPAYNRSFSLEGRGFELERRRALNWNPLTWKPVPRVLAHPGDAYGCGHYRIIKPFEALAEAGMISGEVTWDLFPPVNLAKADGDVLVFQRQTTEHQLKLIEIGSKTINAFRVYELDDYLPNIPLKSAHREHMPRDILKSLRKALGMMDRFVVSTAALANAYDDLHSKIVVVENALPPAWWNVPTPRRRVSRKPRVGWAGGASHAGDLAIIADVVKALSQEVEWVFMGMCPDNIRRYVHEFHEGVPIEAYPAKLASLNLDLALAPLEHNLFNECKSNLRLLEYGICGYPVICTAITPYLGDLPVTTVKNRHKFWVDAIREHLHDLDETARRGDALREAVKQRWMLEGERLDQWLAAWLPD